MQDFQKCAIWGKYGAYSVGKVETIGIDRGVAVFIFPKRSKGSENGTDSSAYTKVWVLEECG